MSTSTWNDHPTPAQMSPHGSYQPNFDGEDDNNYGRPGNPSDHYDPDDNGTKYESYHGSMKNYDDDHQQQQQSPKQSSHHHDAYSHHGMSDGGSVKGGYGGDGGSPHGSLKEFASDNGSGMRGSKYSGGHGGGSERGGGSLKDGHGDMMKEHKFGGSEYGDGGGRGLPVTHNSESERESAGGVMSSMMDSWRPGMSWIDRRTFCMGDSCAAPPDWENHPILRQVPTQDHQAYRYSKIQLGSSYNPTLKFQQTSEVPKVCQ